MLHRDSGPDPRQARRKTSFKGKTLSSTRLPMGRLMVKEEEENEEKGRRGRGWTET